MSMNSGNGFVSSIWGPALWMVIHCISMNYPSTPTDEDRHNYGTWFEGLAHVLPCGTCRTNFKTNLKEIEYDREKHLESRLMFSYIVYKLHNSVRKMQGKSTDMTFIECILFYEQFRAQDCTPNTASGEGGCFAKTGLTCTLVIAPDKKSVNDGRFTIDPSCDIQII